MYGATEAVRGLGKRVAGCGGKTVRRLDDRVQERVAEGWSCRSGGGDVCKWLCLWAKVQLV